MNIVVFDRLYLAIGRKRIGDGLARRLRERDSRKLGLSGEYPDDESADGKKQE
jgi:hypothetical protein